MAQLWGVGVLSKDTLLVIISDRESNQQRLLLPTSLSQVNLDQQLFFKWGS